MLLLNSMNFSIGFNGKFDMKWLPSRHSLVQGQQKKHRNNV